MLSSEAEDLPSGLLTASEKAELNPGAALTSSLGVNDDRASPADLLSFSHLRYRLACRRAIANHLQSTLRKSEQAILGLPALDEQPCAWYPTGPAQPLQVRIRAGLDSVPPVPRRFRAGPVPAARRVRQHPQPARAVDVGADGVSGAGASWPVGGRSLRSCSFGAIGGRRPAGC